MFFDVKIVSSAMLTFASGPKTKHLKAPDAKVRMAEGNIWTSSWRLALTGYI